VELEIPEQSIIPGQEERDGQGEKLPTLDEDILGRIRLAVKEIRGGVSLRERRTVRS
jgi:hypothetical protein